MRYVTNVQWKGTDLCMDFNCPNCEQNSHFDGITFGFIKCFKCETNFQLQPEIAFSEVTEAETFGGGLVGESTH